MRSIHRGNQSSDQILKKIHKILKEDYGFYFSTVQIERECTDSGEADHIDIKKRTKWKMIHKGQH